MERRDIADLRDRDYLNDWKDHRRWAKWKQAQDSLKKERPQPDPKKRQR